MSKKASKGRFFGCDKLKSLLTKEREGENRKSVEEERRRREESNGCTISFNNGYLGRSKKLSIKKVHLVVTFSKIWLDMVNVFVN